MQTMRIDYPDEGRLSLNLTPEQFAAEIRMAAVKQFETGRLSSGRVADLAGVSCKLRFVKWLSRTVCETGLGRQRPLS